MKEAEAEAVKSREGVIFYLNMTRNVLIITSCMTSSSKAIARLTRVLFWGMMVPNIE